MTTKNPYELRFDLLKYARTNLMEKYYSDMDLHNENPRPGTRPEYPTTEQLFKLAEEYKSFIERK